MSWTVRRLLVDVLIGCAGIDIGKDEVVACVRTPAPVGRDHRGGNSSCLVRLCP